MIRKPNGFQKLLHRIVMLRPVTAFFAPRIHRLDQFVFRWTGNRYTAAELLGWQIIQLTTTGARTGQPRTVPLVGIFEGQKIALIASSFGRPHNPGWYYNLKAHPECTVFVHGHSASYVAREVRGEEYGHSWQLAVSYYAGYEEYRQRASHRHIPVMLLEPKE